MASGVGDHFRFYNRLDLRALGRSRKMSGSQVDMWV